jgi:PAS domain S-box-containing protein
MTFPDLPGRGVLLLRTKLERWSRPQRLAVLWVAGGVTLALAAAVCSRLGLDFATAAFALLIVVVGLSLLEGFMSSAILSVTAVGCLKVFVLAPGTISVAGDAQQPRALSAFLLTALAVSCLAKCVGNQAEAARQRTQLVVDSLPALAASYGPDGRREFFNERALSFHGASPAEVAGAETWLAVHPADIAEAERAWQHSLATGDAFEREMRFLRADGEYRWHLNRRAPYRDQSGRIIRWYGVAFDIEEQKRAEAALRRSEVYLAEAQKLSHTGSSGWNLASGEIYWSDETFRIFGYETTIKPSHEMVLQERVHPEDVALVRQVFDRALREVQSFDIEHRLLMPDGSIKHLHVIGHPASGSGHLEFIGAVSDITDRKEAYEALERSAQRYRAIFEHMPIGLCQVDATAVMPLFQELRDQGVTDLKAYIDEHPELVRRSQDLMIVEEANEELARIHGAKSAAEMTGPATRFWEPDLFDGPRRLLESRYRGEMFSRSEIKLRTLDGRVIDVIHAVARAGPTLGKSLVGVIDITDRVRAQEMLNRLQADFAHAARVSMLGELTASIAHEVNQPLAAIATNGEAGLRWLARPGSDLEEVRELMREVVADARRAADVIGRVRALATRQVPKKVPLSLDEIIRETLLFLRHEIQARAVTVSHHATPEAPVIVGDRTQLQQVIVNLAVNAMQAMALAHCSERRIAIHTAMSDGATLCCSVEDTGPGLLPEHVDRLFESFFTTKDGGMGMGLAICRSIIEAHGGSITAEYRAGGGARFCFRLPVVEMHVGAEQGSQP